jgi:hypothetical protein
MPSHPSQGTWSRLTVGEVASLLAACPVRWWLSGGWAVDHWLGRTTRRHGDIDVSTCGPHLAAVLTTLPAGLEPFAAQTGELLSLASVDSAVEVHNIWVRRRDTGRWVLQVNVEAGDQDAWAYRRHPEIRLPWDHAVVDVRGVPTGTPATQLLWKSRDPRPQDESDLDEAGPRLPAAERRWLVEAVRASHPASPWADDPRLTAGRRDGPPAPLLGDD